MVKGGAVSESTRLTLGEKDAQLGCITNTPHEELSSAKVYRDQPASRSHSSVLEKLPIPELLRRSFNRHSRANGGLVMSCQLYLGIQKPSVHEYLFAKHDLLSCPVHLLFW